MSSCPSLTCRRNRAAGTAAHSMPFDLDVTSAMLGSTDSQAGTEARRAETAATATTAPHDRASTGLRRSLVRLSARTLSVSMG